MGVPSYAERLATRIHQTGSGLCVGLDPRPERHASLQELEDFCLEVIRETEEYAATFKPNAAYFEAMGSAGYAALERVIAVMKETDVPIILDAKRGDIGTTQEHYAKGYFGLWDVDAVTLSPYMGYDSVEPFLGYEGKGVYLLGVTSNAGAADLELHDLKADGRKVFELVGDMAKRGAAGQIGMVLGLTNATEDVLKRLPDVPLLIPGLGAQGGDVSALKGESRTAPSVINVSRGILYSDEKPTIRERAKFYADEIAKVI